MANEVLVKSGTPISVTMTSLNSLASVTTGGAQSIKSDLGATRAERMLLRLQLVFGTAPTAGGTLDVFVGFSTTSSATVGNPANLSGSDAAYSGYTNDAQHAKQHLCFVGVFYACATTVAQVADIGVFTPLDRYGMVVVVPSGVNQALSNAGHAVTLFPLVQEVQ